MWHFEAEGFVDSWRLWQFKAEVCGQFKAVGKQFEAVVAVRLGWLWTAGGCGQFEAGFVF